jgi:serine/threonine-protein kinase
MDADLQRVERGLPVAHETEAAATAVLAGAGIEEGTRVIPRAGRTAAGATTTARVPPRYGHYYDYEGERPRRPVWPWLLALLLLAAAGYAGYFVYTKVEHQLSSSSIRVDNYKGIVESLAVSKIRKSGLKPRIDREYNANVAVGVVFGQDPSPGASLDKGGTVMIVVSKGKTKVEVPKVVGDNVTDAVAALTAKGLTYKQYQVPSSQAPGTVTGQSPAPGTMVVKGTSVRINVSKGLPPVIVPSDVIGKNVNDATSELQQLGFTVTTQQASSSTKPKDTVIDTNPKPGTSEPRGSQVTLVVSPGPQTAPVPDVRGFSVAVATETVKAAGFNPVIVHQDTPDQTEDGLVISESPEQNTQAPLNSNVTLTVGHFVNSGPTGATGATGPTGASP